ncbi:uncharacterized protein LOC106876203 [Octopus bimaculoides]|uniref:uncharacterized protein LOC106876203 n=1 Tax=Octopus bimaculoides TaxID=37653 RepID=UPI0022E643EA|nr:uncharacterized protein LOC106876203 [Octopus bimaculoides]
MTPAEGIEVGNTYSISITCQYKSYNLLDFKLQQNGNTVVHILYSPMKKGYKRLKTSDGFDCDLPVDIIGNVTCWKYNPTCKDVAAYSCKTFYKTSKRKVFKAKSTLESLEILKGLNKQGREVKNLRCVANIGAPFKSQETFMWITTKNGKNFYFIKKEQIPLTSGCYSLVSSDYTFTSPAKNVSATNITCKTNFASLRVQINDEMENR